MCLEYLGTANEIRGLVPYGRHLSRPFPVDGLTSFGSGLGEVSKGFTAMFQCVGNLFRAPGYSIWGYRSDDPKNVFDLKYLTSVPFDTDYDKTSRK